MNNSSKLWGLALRRFFSGIIMIAVLLFISGGLNYINAWIYVSMFSIMIFLFGVFLYVKDKELLEKRINFQEEEKEQESYTSLAGISLLLTFVISGLDNRFNWSFVSETTVVIALIIMMLGFVLFVLTIIQNRFASRTIEIQDEQKVVDSGVYSIVRHPLYTSTIIMFFSSPIVLGSIYAIIPVLLFLLGIILRIKNEESFLIVNLAGYVEYVRKVKYRLIPFIW